MRYATARRRFAEKAPPRRFLAWGDEEMTHLLVRTAVDTLEPDAVYDLWPDDDPEVLLRVLRSRTEQRQTRVAVLHDVASMAHTPEVLRAANALTPVTGLYCLGTSVLEPDHAWLSVFDSVVDTRISRTEQLALSQSLLGGCAMDLAEDLCERLQWHTPDLIRTARLLNCYTDRPEGSDFDLVVPEPTGDYVEALVACDTARALRTAPSVVDGDLALAKIRSDLLVLWVLVEARPSPAGKRPVQAAKDLDLPVPAVERLLPLIRRYSRASLARRLDALALTAEHYRKGHRRTWEVLATLWAL